jgi:hypothetical protein
MARVVVLYFGPIVTRKDAASVGRRRYFTGKPCVHGHVEERLVSCKKCCECHRLLGQNGSYITSDARRLRRRESRDTKRVSRTGRPKPSMCDLCERKVKVVFDHCHASGCFRGWICNQCNQTLGLVRDDPSLLRRMARYLEKHNGASDDETTEPTPIERLCRTGSFLPN